MFTITARYEWSTGMANFEVVYIGNGGAAV